MELPIIKIIELVGTMAFAISGIRLAAAKQMDFFGAYVIGLMTAIGGGTVRDVLLDETPFWMLDSSYLIVTGVSLAVVVILGRRIIHLNNTFFIFDTIGLALFTVVGVEKTLVANYPFWVAIVMGTITGAFGGVLRDMLINEVPLIFRTDIYGLSCIVGGVLYATCTYFGVSQSIVPIISALSIVLVRVVAVKYNLSLPVLRNDEEK